MAGNGGTARHVLRRRAASWSAHPPDRLLDRGRSGKPCGGLRIRAWTTPCARLYLGIPGRRGGVFAHQRTWVWLATPQLAAAVPRRRRATPVNLHAVAQAIGSDGSSGTAAPARGFASSSPRSRGGRAIMMRPIPRGPVTPTVPADSRQGGDTLPAWPFRDPFRGCVWPSRRRAHCLRRAGNRRLRGAWRISHGN